MDNTQCSICGKTFDEWDREQNFYLGFNPGFGSKYDAYDGEPIDLHMCCECFDKMMDYVYELKSSYTAVID